MIKQFYLAIAFTILPLVSFAQTTLKGVDASCSQESNQAAQHCEGTAVIKQCWRQRLTADCFKMVEAGNGTQDMSCKQQLKDAAAPCLQESQTFSAQCMEKNLSQRCVGQLSEAGKVLQKSMKACQEVMQKRASICKAEAQNDDKKLGPCFQRYEPEVQSACQ